jgi:2-polyprenyl-3-methyl-5-hydroxy-6-metoxy-1,4-benzoquinol methylase
MKNLKHCPICNSEENTLYLQCKDYTVTNEVFDIVQCSSCGFKFTNPRPNDEDLGKYYESEEYISHSRTNKGLIYRLYHIARNYTLSNKYNLVKNTSAKKLLDIGCGTGEFLNFCQSKDMQVVGVEPSDKARDFAISEYNLEIHKEDFLQTSEDKFDAITMWHVLEHVPNLNKRLEEIHNLLNNNGYLYIAVPNCESCDAQLYRQYWAAYDVPRHLYHFTKKDIYNLADKHSFAVDKILPMKLDSFYVSMLSEKYKNGKINYLSAFIIGLLSNIKAGKDNYSSLIYVLKKAK